jgi:hypothetical protein
LRGEGDGAGSGESEEADHDDQDELDQDHLVALIVRLESWICRYGRVFVQREIEM